jgi:hypothetical protein
VAGCTGSWCGALSSAVARPLLPYAPAVALSLRPRAWEEMIWHGFLASYSRADMPKLQKPHGMDLTLDRMYSGAEAR